MRVSASSPFANETRSPGGVLAYRREAKPTVERDGVLQVIRLQADVVEAKRGPRTSPPNQVKSRVQSSRPGIGANVTAIRMPPKQTPTMWFRFALMLRRRMP